MRFSYSSQTISDYSVFGCYAFRKDAWRTKPEPLYPMLGYLHPADVPGQARWILLLLPCSHAT